jgi:alpha-beta hydrolase superfamily lysophospholipase
MRNPALLVSISLMLPLIACSNDTPSGETGQTSETTSNDTTGPGDGDGDGDGAPGDGDGDGAPGDGDGDGAPGDGDGDGDPGPEPGTVMGCADSTFYEVPADPSARGPWAVGARTIVINGVTTEIWYPAAWGSEAGDEPRVYDIRYALPESEQPKITDAKNPQQPCDCYADLPIDDQHGPYPVVVFVHGTASWRSQSLTQMTHWASRGFIVVSSDHEGLWLRDILAPLCGQAGGNQDLSGDTDVVLAALASPAGELAFLAGHVDTDRVAISGHSAGGSAASAQTNKPGIRVSIPMATGAAVMDTPMLESVLLLGAMSDGVVNYGGTQNAFNNSPSPKRLVGIENAGHLAFSDICELKNADGQNILEVALEAGVCGAQFAGFLFDCDPNFIDAAIAGHIINYSSTAVLEQVLRCVEGPDLFASFADEPGVGEYQEQL